MADDLVLPMAELKLDSTPVNSSPITLVSRHEEAEGGLTVTDDSKGDSDEEGDIIILHTADDVAILASFDILAKYSPFFATLRDLPRPDGIHESVIPLPSASSTGLALVISVLEDLNATSAADAGATVAGGGTEVDWTTVSEADLAHVTAAMEVADAYDIPAFTSYYIDKVHKAMDKNPSLAFTMAALGKDQQKAKQSARDILRPWHRLSTGMTALLQEHAPEYLDALRTFISRYDRAHTKFLADLRSNETMENGFNDYGQMCKRDYHGCVTHDRYKSFRKMRVAYANQEFHKLVDIAFSESHWYHVNVGC